MAGTSTGRTRPRPRSTAGRLAAHGRRRLTSTTTGYLFLTDRIKDMIVSGGENVYPIEVEEVLASIRTSRRRRDRRAARALGRDGEGARRAAARLRPSAEELVAFARERLAGYKLPRESSSSTICRGRRPARCSSASCRERNRAASPTAAVRKRSTSRSACGASSVEVPGALEDLEPRSPGFARRASRPLTIGTIGPGAVQHERRDGDL
jgi:hypothetical protein